MRYTLLATTLLLVVCLSGCELLDGTDDAPPVLIVPFDGGGTSFARDTLSVEQARIRGDVLILEVAYPGGCAEHAFVAYSPGPIIRTLPPGADVFLAHDARGDACTDQMRKEVRFSLTPLRARESDEVLVFVLAPGTSGFAARLRYRY